MITGEQIRDARKRAGLSQAELAKRVGVVPRTVGGWERGENAPGIAEPRLLEVLREQLVSTDRDMPLDEVSDVELLAEVARRIGRSARRDQDEVRPRPIMNGETVPDFVWDDGKGNAILVEVKDSGPGVDRAEVREVLAQAMAGLERGARHDQWRRRDAEEDAREVEASRLAIGRGAVARQKRDLARQRQRGDGEPAASDVADGGAG